MMSYSKPVGSQYSNCTFTTTGSLYTLILVIYPQFTFSHIVIIDNGLFLSNPY